ncbi:glucosyltransferase domain-containing protein [Raoultella ornithinolytica]
MKLFKIYALSILAFAFPMLLANVYYIDDIGRSTSGYTKWGIDGRPVADMIMSSLNLSSHLVDLFPLPLLLSIACLSFTLLMFKDIFIGNGRLSFVVPIAFLCNPFFLEVLSYRFDVLTISIGVMCSFLSFKRLFSISWINFCAQTILITIVFCTYQPIINIVIILCALEIFSKMRNNISPIDIICNSILRVTQLIASSLLYIKVILPITFVGIHSTSHPSISKNVSSTLLENINSYYTFIVNNYFFSYGGVLLACAYILSLLLTAYLVFSYIKDRKGENTFLLISLSIIALFATIISPLLSMFSLLFLEHPLTTFSRVYIGFGGYFLFLFSLLYYTINKIRANFLIAIITVPFMYSMILSYAYGNAIREQDKIDEDLISEIKSSTSDYPYNSMYIVFNGSPMKSAVFDNTVKNYPLIKYLVVDYFSNWYWPFRKMMINGYRQLYPSKQSGIVKESLSKVCDFTVSKKNQDFNILIKDNVIIIDFDKVKC